MGIEFEFVNAGEFGNPFYVVSVSGTNFGKLKYKTGEWNCSLSANFMYNINTFHEIAEKLKDLNESLEQQRKEYFGLI